MVATVSNAAGSRGQATGVSAGGAGIKAALDGKEGIAKLGVTAPDLKRISVEPIMPTRRVGQTVQFGAVGVFSNNTVQNLTARATWTISNMGVATLTPMGAATCATRAPPR
jgi:hypothetical protein